MKGQGGLEEVRNEPSASMGNQRTLFRMPTKHKVRGYLKTSLMYVESRRKDG